MTQKEIEALAEEAFDAACLVIQKRLGVTSGDVAALFFSNDVTRQNLEKYIRHEDALREL